jgi:hypothetical protein
MDEFKRRFWKIGEYGVLLAQSNSEEWVVKGRNGREFGTTNGRPCVQEIKP